jgi:hypothetical protein
VSAAGLRRLTSDAEPVSEPSDPLAADSACPRAVTEGIPPGRTASSRSTNSALYSAGVNSLDQYGYRLDSVADLGTARAPYPRLRAPRQPQTVRLDQDRR